MLYTYQKHVDNAVAKYPSSSVVLIVSILLRFNEMFVLDDYFLADWQLRCIWNLFDL